ncbi:protein MAINTENANCE OF MERISTEMS [Sesamum angolense]|uniref:Protein MAINTENANCE OF MERISTEMS n=1 Tax=Sesamum angolense TaxID=2727404 RepID=A0AAE2BTW9_9LAMI|nr:protein MAINTENANCE OF MERISTEMS [Sesamum angolense]
MTFSKSHDLDNIFDMDWQACILQKFLSMRNGPTYVKELVGDKLDLESDLWRDNQKVKGMVFESNRIRRNDVGHRSKKITWSYKIHYGVQTRFERPIYGILVLTSSKDAYRPLRQSCSLTAHWMSVMKSIFKGLDVGRLCDLSGVDLLDTESIELTRGDRHMEALEVWSSEYVARTVSLKKRIHPLSKHDRIYRFRTRRGALKGSRLQVKAIISHISRVHITPDTPHLTVVQYARAVALLLLGGTMCPDSSGNLVSLLYLAKLEDIVAARNYSWGSAVLAFLYRELCNASKKGKAAIGGALQLVQPYDMESNVIMAYVGDFNPQLWRSICPLIFYAIVEMHHPERVLRQFGMMQNIPDQPDTRDMSLHKITRSNRTGTDWVLQHILYITRWQRRYDTVIQRQPISNRRDTDRGYWE